MLGGLFGGTKLTKSPPWRRDCIWPVMVNSFPIPETRTQTQLQGFPWSWKFCLATIFLLLPHWLCGLWPKVKN